MIAEARALHATIGMQLRPPSRTGCVLALLAFAITCAGSSTVAHAQEHGATPPDASDARFSLHVELEGVVRVDQGPGFTATCTAPCILRVPPGYLTVTAPSNATEIYLERDSRLRATAAVPALRSVGAALLATGAAIVAVAALVPLLACVFRPEHVDAQGRTTRGDNPCAKASDGMKVAWISGAGVGLTSAIVGGIVYASAGPHLRLADLPAAQARERISPGLSLSVRF